MNWLKIQLTEFTGHIAASRVQVWLCKAVDYSVLFYELCCFVIFLIFVQSSWESYQSSVQGELQHCHLLILMLFDPDVLVVAYSIEMVLNSVNVKNSHPGKQIFWISSDTLADLTCHIDIKCLMLYFKNIIVQYQWNLVDNAAKLFQLDLHKTIDVHTLRSLYPVISVRGVLVISWRHAWFTVLFDFYLATWRDVMLQ